VVGVLGVALVTASCTSTTPGAQVGAAAPICAAADLDGTLWRQTAVEAEGLALQAYALATLRLQKALADPEWTAALEQEGGVSHLPPAVILDVDETVLDTSPFEARALRWGEPFDPARWQQWVERGQAQPVPAALEFCRCAADRGVAVVFISNRGADEEEATRENLRRAGFPLDTALDSVLTRGERPEWGSDNGSRRGFVAASHRVLLLLGDDLGDFVSGTRAGLAARRELAQTHSRRWGRSWILLPNPVYGSWERAITGGAEGEDACRLTFEALKGY
jgi:acid phosphatase